MPLYSSDKLFPLSEMPVGTWRNGVGFNASTATSSTLAVLISGAADNTRFSIFYVPANGTFSVEYNLSTYVDGTIQEAIFKYDPFGQLGTQIVNQNWSTPAVGLRQITGCSMDAGLYFLCLRNSSSSNNMGVLALGSSASGANTIDFGMYTCYYKINGALEDASFQNYCYGLWDNSTNPALQANYNGALSDFSPYQNCVASNKYLFPLYDTLFYKVRLNRTA
jgi:hypothetical protein